MRKLTVVLVIVLGLLLIPAGAAFADAGSHGKTHASCIGIESSSISPAGTTDEFPGGRSSVNFIIREAYPGVPLGRIYSEVAKLHLETHAGCDAE